MKIGKGLKKLWKATTPEGHAYSIHRTAWRKVGKPALERYRTANGNQGAGSVPQGQYNANGAYGIRRDVQLYGNYEARMGYQNAMFQYRLSLQAGGAA